MFSIGLGTGHHDHPVIGITDQAVIGQALSSTLFASARKPERLPGLSEMFVEDRKSGVR